MTRSLLSDAFDHNAWATLAVIDACEALTPEQLETHVPGTYGSIIGTLRHLVASDAWYLHVITGGSRARIEEDDEERLDLAALRVETERMREDWAGVLARVTDPDEIVVRRRDDGSEAHAPISLRLAQALNHGTDHRSQICTALTTLGIEPPEIDLWAYGTATDRFTEVPAPA